MTKRSELHPRNYKRIYWINLLLTVPLMIFFAWPYVVFGYWADLRPVICYTGALFFSIPFTLTLLHGHVTLALGSSHRHHYYQWLGDHPLTYGLFFHPIFTGTRFRLIVLSLSILIFISGFIFVQ